MAYIEMYSGVINSHNWGIFINYTRNMFR